MNGYATWVAKGKVEETKKKYAVIIINETRRIRLYKKEINEIVKPGDLIVADGFIAEHNYILNIEVKKEKNDNTQSK